MAALHANKKKSSQKTNISSVSEPGQGSTSYSSDGALARKLTSHFANSDLADITVKVGQRLFPAHRLVLGAWSEPLAQMMKILEGPGEVLEISSIATDQEVKVFEDFLRFLYTGEVTFTAENVKMLMAVSDKMGVMQLRKMGEEWLADMIDNGNVLSAISWLREAMDCNLPSLKERCLRTLGMYFEYIPEASWLALSSEEVINILDQADLVVDDEAAVIERVDTWLAAKGNPADNEEFYIKMASKINFQYLEASQLDALEATSALVQFTKNSNPQTLLEAFKFRAFASELADGDSEDRDHNSLIDHPYVNPRFYLDFVPPGKRKKSYIARRSAKKETFREVEISGYRNDMKCVCKKLNGSWVRDDRAWAMNVKLESKKVGKPEVWSLTYEIKPENRGDPEQHTYKVVVVTRPLDKDAQFYLPDNPVVVTCQGSIRYAAGSSHTLASFTLTTPPVFAGRKPKRVEVSAIAYVIKHPKQCPQDFIFDD